MRFFGMAADLSPQELHFHLGQGFLIDFLALEGED